jgi:hypothetical protein
MGGGSYPIAEARVTISPVLKRTPEVDGKYGVLLTVLPRYLRTVLRNRPTFAPLSICELMGAMEGKCLQQ